jgi:hypothetical protein
VDTPEPYPAQKNAILAALDTCGQMVTENAHAMTRNMSAIGTRLLFGFVNPRPSFSGHTPCDDAGSFVLFEATAPSVSP